MNTRTLCQMEFSPEWLAWKKRRYYLKRREEGEMKEIFRGMMQYAQDRGLTAIIGDIEFRSYDPQMDQFTNRRLDSK